MIGLVGAPVVFLLLAGWAALAWFRDGRDPITSTTRRSTWRARRPSLTPAAGAFVLDGGPSRRALTTALLDLASRGEISFREAADDEPGWSASTWSMAASSDRRRRDRQHPAARVRRSSSPLDDLRVLGHGKAGGYLVGTSLQRFSGSVDRFNAALERQVIAGGWYKEAPRIPRNRWLGRGILEIFGAIVLWFLAAFITSSGVTLRRRRAASWRAS